MLTNEKVNSELRDYINTGYEILMNNMDYEVQANISSIMKLSVANDEGSSFEFKRNMLIGILKKVKDEEE